MNWLEAPISLRWMVPHHTYVLSLIQVIPIDLFQHTMGLIPVCSPPSMMDQILDHCEGVI